MTPDKNAQIREIQDRKKSLVCVGLDPDLSLIPGHLGAGNPIEAVRTFCAAIIDATAPVACAFKINFAFFEALGPEGWRLLKDTVSLIPSDTFKIADAKRGDIGNSARFYADAIYSNLGFDACTVAPYMGKDSIEPFLQYEGKTAFVLARTSNSGANDFQEIEIEGRPLYLHVAARVSHWAESLPGSAGLVVGATDPVSLSAIRMACPDVPFLIPGIGAQGGEIESVIRNACSDGSTALINSSRQILYASNDSDFAVAAHREAESLRTKIESIRCSFTG